MFIGIFQGIIDVLADLSGVISNVLPVSPFRVVSSITIDNSILGAINYFLPITEIIAIFDAWLICVVLFYLWMIVGRWVKLID